MNKASWPNLSKGERRWHWTSFSQKGFYMYLTQNKPKILQSQYHAVVLWLLQHSRREWGDAVSRCSRKKSKLSEQNPPALQGQSHPDALWESGGTTDRRFAPRMRVTGSPEQDGKPLVFFSLSWESLVWCHKVANDTESWSLIVHVMKVAWT